jgi:sulfite exporter TauE/SafE
MLALAASYGVFNFARLFVPFWVAVIQAAAFELVYIGMAVTPLTNAQRQRANLIALGAVVVSMAYNSLDGLFHRRPELLADTPLWADVILALLHGVPLAALAYLVSDLLLHRQTYHDLSDDLSKSTTALFDKSNVRTTTAQIVSSSGRPGALLLSDLLSAVETDFSRETAMEVLETSASTVDRLLAEGVEQGKLVRVARGRYQVVQQDGE